MLPASLESNIVGKKELEEVIKKLEEMEPKKKAKSNTSMENYPPTPTSASEDSIHTDGSVPSYKQCYTK